METTELSMVDGEYRMPVADIRKGDRIHKNGIWYTVVESRQWLGDPESVIKWTIDVMIPDTDWDWKKYPTYGYQDSDDYDDPRPFVPEDCRIEFAFADWDSELTVYTSKVEQIHPETLRPIRWWVNVYDMDRCYSGPEEGGTWHDVGTLKISIPCRDWEQAYEKRDEMKEIWPRTGKSNSVIYSGSGDYSVSVSKKPGADYSTYMPYR